MKIKSIIKSELVEPNKFYDITVEKYHNFSITNSNIIVHNSAIANTVLKMARKFQSAEPILHGDGFFGSVISHHGAAARYTRVKTNPKISKVIDEFSHLNERNPEGLIEQLKVKFPIGLLGMTLGIAVGFATKILPRKFEEIEKFLNGKKANLKPYFCEFDGDVENFNKKNVWLFKGKCVIGDDSIVYKSIPPFMNFPSFLKKINSIINKVGSDKVEVYNRCNDTIDFEIKFDSKEEFETLKSQLIKANQMLFTENIVLISNKTVIEYESIEDYLTQFRIKNEILFYEELKYNYSYIQDEIKNQKNIVEFMKFMYGSKKTGKEIDEFYSKYNQKTKLLFDNIKLRNLTLDTIKKIQTEIELNQEKVVSLKGEIANYNLPPNFKFRSTKKLDFGGVILSGEIEEFIIEEDVQNNIEEEEDVA